MAYVHRSLGRRATGAAIAVMAALALMLTISGTASAAPGDAQHVRPETVAIAIGTIGESDGGHTWLSLQAGTAAGISRGGFRYFCAEAGYYNGAVRQLTVTDGAVHAEGAGGLRRPDGTRMRVTFVLDIAADGSSATVKITGDNYDYEMSGSLDGFVFAGNPGGPSAP
ncbi:MAG: hypothetical protein O3B31_08460 [Chloroflexi bacterium]|nr:hypothetical protein [Chloroflexota bacterium]MDA1003361.1 hypothetical protein [Chloroflexota bacterium]